MAPSLRHCLTALSAMLMFALPSEHAAAGISGYYSHPDIHGDRIVFVSEDDLWLVSADGGVATRLTTDRGQEYNPRFSPDGTKIAFAAEFDGNRDTYVMPATGGPPTRLTWHPYREEPTAWTPDGKYIIHHSSRGHAMYNRSTFKVPVDGGMPELLFDATACYLTMAPDGDTVAFNRNVQQMRTWKRYGGGTQDDIWIGSVRDGNFRRLTTYFGNDLSPMFVGGRLYFASERDGRMNLWSMTTAGADLRQHTFFSDFDVRWPESDGQSRIVFQLGADIWLYDTLSEKASLVEILIPSDRVDTRLQIADASEYFESASIANDGKRALLTIRGDIFNAPVKHGRTIPLTSTTGARERDAVFAGEKDEFVLYFSDASGDNELMIADARTGANAAQITKPGDVRRGTHPVGGLAVAPNGQQVAWSDQTGTLYWTNITTRTLTLVDSSERWEVSQYEWSPDSNYLAFAKYLPTDMSQVLIHDIRTGETTAVTDPMFSSTSPTWDPDGDFLFFLSNRTFESQYAAYEHERVMTDPTKPYALLLRKDVDSPFYRLDPYEEADEEEGDEEDEDAGEDEDGEGDEEEADEDEEGDEDEEEEPFVIDFDGIIDRAVAFPIANGGYWGLTAVNEKVFIGGRSDDSDDHSGSGGGYPLFQIKYKDDDVELTPFLTAISGYVLSSNKEHMVYFSGGAPFVVSTGAESVEEPEGPSLHGIHVRVDPPAEWAQILREVYRYNRDFFYMEDMAGVPWKEMYERYATLLPRIGIRQELSDIVGELIGELGHGHTYLWGSGDDPTPGRSIATGLLGADLAAENGRVVLKRILRGERWEPELAAPFNNSRTAAVAEGSTLLAVNGRPVSADADPYEHFWGLAGQDVLLTVSPDGTEENAEDYRVTLISDESALRYRQWVKDKRDYVSEKTNGEVGYIHLPDMDAAGYVSFFRDYFPQIRKKALVVDVRWNGGGNVSQLLLRRLAAKVLNIGKARNFDTVETYPSTVHVGPMACIINENAGSDGDIFPHTFRQLGLGPLIGARTWGGVVGIRAHTRVLDGQTVTVPEFSSIDFDLGYDIENYGIKPSEGFEVELGPNEEVAGADPQLDTAIEYLLMEMKKPEYQFPELPADGPDRSTRAFRERSKDWMTKP